MIYGISPGFDPLGIMHELLHGFKESEKEICDNGTILTLEECVHRRNLALPLFNGYYKQASPPKASTHSKGLENSLNKNKEFTQNGCRIFHLEYDSSDNARMELVWRHFKDSGQSELVLGRQSRVYVLPSPGKLVPATVTSICHYMSFHLRYTSATQIHSHPTLMNLDKWTEVTMEDTEALPSRKYTTMQHEYTDLRTPSNHKVFHAIYPREVSLDRESSVDCMFLEKNKLARNISLKIQVCPSAWWWNLFTQV